MICGLWIIITGISIGVRGGRITRAVMIAFNGVFHFVDKIAHG